MKFIIFSVFCVAVTLAVPFDVFEDEDGQQYYAIPVGREKRQTKVDINQSGVGLSHTGNIFNNDKHRLDGTASAGKNFGSHGFKPDQLGGRLDYSYKPSRSSVFIGADNTRGFGTDLNAGAKYNIHQSKNLGIDVTGQYGRHFGGPGGTGRPNYGVFLNANARF